MIAMLGSDNASSVQEETTSSMYSAGKEYKPSTEWTDEKHSLYLKSMEASFVHQLYNSLGSNVRSSTRFGCVRKVPSEEHVVSSNGKKGLVICSSGSASSLNNMLREGCSRSRDWDQISTVEEVSGQNFINDNENGSSKKMKTVMSGSSSTDQVVPLRTANMT